MRKKLMNIITHAPMPLKLSGAVLALALIAVVAVAVILTGSSVQAQAPNNTYAAPKPCGPGQDNFSANPSAQITAGRIALFDAYWHRDEKSDPSDPNTGSLNINLCPPEV